MKYLELKETHLYAGHYKLDLMLTKEGYELLLVLAEDDKYNDDAIFYVLFKPNREEEGWKIINKRNDSKLISIMPPSRDKSYTQDLNQSIIDELIDQGFSNLYNI